MIKIVEENKDYQKWVSETSITGQLNAMEMYYDYEDYGYVERCNTVEELANLFAFVNFVVGVEFISGVYELMREELEDGDYTTSNNVKTFNEQMGREML